MAKAKLKNKKRAKEEEIKQEEFDDRSSLEVLVSKYKNIIIPGAVVLLLAIIGYLGFNYWNGLQNEEANELMFQAVKYFEADSLDLALNGDSNSGALGLLDIENDYSTTDAANMARYYIGIIHLKKGELQEGVDYLEKVSKPSGSMFAVSVNAALGYAYEDLGDPSQAASYFEKAANSIEDNEHTTPTILMNAGRNYEAAGDKSKALRVYEKIKKEFPLSTEGRQIEKYIGRVSE